jgi:uncharacterized protein
MLLVSIHDVSPAQFAPVAHLWTLCRERGLTPALLVVPNWHGAWPLELHPWFVDWVRARAAEGAEIALHGERHDEVGLPRGWTDSWQAWGRTKREGEFLTLNRVEARRRIDRGLSLFRRFEIPATGFVPPAWLAREDTHAAAAAAGLEFSEDHRSVRLLQSGSRVSSPVVRWSARTRIRALGSVWVAAARSLFQRGARYPRIALHPGDLSSQMTAGSVCRTLDRWLRQHAPGRYADLRSGIPA